MLNTEIKETLVLRLEDAMPLGSAEMLTKIEQGAACLRAGGTVIFPTETVYGLGAHALDPEATQKIYTAKGRPSDNPLIVHIHHRSLLEPLIKCLPEKALALMDAFWPGPLTLVFIKSDAVPLSVTGGLNTVAVRMPDHPIALALIEAAGVPVAAPSANLSGKPSPTKAAHVIADMMGRVDAIVTFGDVDYGIESTVLDVTEETPILLRPGSVTQEQIEAVIGPIDRDQTILEAFGHVAPRAPGMKYRHYAPNAKVFVVDQGMTTAVLNQHIANFEGAGDRVMVVDIADAVELGRVLFDQLRDADIHGYTVVLIRAVALEGVGLAVMNRLLKAASHQVLR